MDLNIMSEIQLDHEFRLKENMKWVKFLQYAEDEINKWNLLFEWI